MVDVLSKQYTSAFTTPDPTKRVLDPIAFFRTGLPSNISSLTDIEFSPNDVQNTLEMLKITSGNGPDGWSAFLLHKYARIYAYPIFLLWHRSLDTGLMPEGINLAFISPIFKGGDKAVPANYRPIALTSHLTKTFERLLRTKIIRAPCGEQPN